MKTCFRCGRELPLTEFYRHPQMGDGLLGKCKECTKADVREREARLRNNPRWMASERRRGREKYHRLYRPAEPLRRKREGWSEATKAHARDTLSNAVRDGRMVRPEMCEYCGVKPESGFKSGIEGHHEDYNKPLYVWWLCVACHVLADAGRLTREMAA